MLSVAAVVDYPVSDSKSFRYLFCHAEVYVLCALIYLNFFIFSDFRILDFLPLCMSDFVSVSVSVLVILSVKYLLVL